MRIRVELFGELANYLKREEDHWELEVDAGITVRELVDKLGVRLGFFGAAVNGRFVDENYRLQEDATLLLFSPVAGG